MQKNNKAKKTTEPSGNTKAEGSVVSLKNRSFQLTLNQVEKYDNLKNYFMGLKSLRYFLAGKEIAPSTGHEHIHIYVYFSVPFNLKLSKCYGSHVEICRGTSKENIDYIKKEETIILDEWGEEPHQGRIYIANVENMSQEERKELPLVFYNIVEKMNIKDNNEITIEEFEKKIEVVYIWGESGVGKTTLAKKLIQRKMNELNENSFNLIKHQTFFWLGIGKSKIALYDDFRDSHMLPSEFINLIDYNIHNMNIKNGYVKNKFEYIVITSVQAPEDLYALMTEKNQEPRKQWLRRLKIINLLNKNDIDNFLI